MNQEQLNQKRQWIQGKFIVGVDPAKDKHRAAIINRKDIMIDKSFSFHLPPIFTIL